MVKHLTVKYIPNYDEYDPNRIEELYDGDKSLYYAADLTECPEDATLARSIMDAAGAVDLIKYGMALRDKGYSDVEVTYEKED